MNQETKDIIVKMLEHQPNIAAVARLVGLSPRYVYNIKGEDPEFAAAIEQAMEVGYDGLEEEAIRRARDGVSKPVFFQGEECGHVREYSDSLLKELLRAYRPKKFNPGIKLPLGDGQKVSFHINIENGDE